MAKNELTVDEWIEELDRGFDFRRRYGLEDTWAQNEALFFNVGQDQDTSAPNIILSSGDALLSTLSVPYPFIDIQPERYDAVEGATILRRLNNKLVKSMGIRQEVPHATINAFLFGVGIMKVGYDSEFGYDPTQDAMGGTGGFTFSQHDKDGNLIEFKGAQPGMPWVESVLPHDIIVPWGTLWLKKAEWIAHRVVRHIDAIKADPKYSGKKDLQPNMSMKDFVQSYVTPTKPWRIGETQVMQGQDVEGECEYVELFEIHDRRTKKIYVIATGHDKFLRNEEDHMQVHGLPFVELSFVPRVRAFWRTSDATYLRQAQAELLDITIQSTKQRRLGALKFLYSKGAITEAELMKLLSTHIGVAAAVEGGFDIDKVIKTFQPTQNPQIYMEAEQVRRNSREIIGMSRNQAGEFESTGRRTATEAGIVDQASQMRANRRFLAVADMYTEVFEKVNRIITKFWKTPRLIDVIGENGLQTWVTYVGAQLKGEYSYSVGFSQDPPLSPMQRKQNALGIYQAMSQDPTVNPLELRKFLANAYDDVNFSRIFQPGVLDGGNGAGVQLQVPGMSGGGGQGQANGGQGQGGGMPAMQGQMPQAALPPNG